MALFLAFGLVSGYSLMIDGEDGFSRELKSGGSRGGGGRSSGGSSSFSGHYYNSSLNRSYYRTNCNYDFTYNYSSKYEDSYNDCFTTGGSGVGAAIFSISFVTIVCGIMIFCCCRKCCKFVRKARKAKDDIV